MNNDLISRSELKKALSKYAGFAERIYLNEFIKEIDNAPTVDAYPFEQVQELVKLNQQFAQEIETLKRPQGRWILVDEGLPERYKEVIVTDIETSGTYQSRYIGNGYWECDNGTFKNRIIAWQPLPEPYKKGEEE